MKRVSSLMCIAMCVIIYLGCGVDTGTTGENQDEQLTPPVYETQSMPEDVKATEAAKSIIEVGGYKYEPVEILVMGEKEYKYIPYIEADDKVQGVLYWDDTYKRKDKDRFNGFNSPAGTETLSRISLSSFFHQISAPNDENDKAIRKCPLIATSRFYNPSGVEDDYYTFSERKYDVRYISFALYENYYREVPQVTVKLYGVSEELWNKHIKERDDHSFLWTDYYKFEKMCEADNYSNCTLIAEKKLDKTGVYYVDFKEIEKTKKYKQYYFTMEMSESMQYSYNVEGWGVYNIVDEAAYTAWKKEHKNQFIAGE